MTLSPDPPTFTPELPTPGLETGKKKKERLWIFNVHECWVEEFVFSFLGKNDLYFHLKFFKLNLQQIILQLKK